MIMKKIFGFLFAAAAMVGCVAEMDNAPVNNGASSSLVLVGETGTVDTKITIGEQSGNVIPVLWDATDAVGVMSLEDAADMWNTQAVVTSGAGTGKASFATVEDFTLAEGSNSLFIYYPYSVDPVISESTIAVSVPAKQEGSAAGIGKYAVGYAKTATVVDEPVKFAMRYANAFVKLTISSEEYSQYTLKSVTLRDLSGEKNLAGSINIDMAAGSSAVATDGLSYIKVVPAEATTLAQAQTFLISTLPADFSAAETPLYIAAELYDPATKNTVTIPVKKNGVLQANALNEIVISNLSLTDNAVDWYQPVETRDLAGGYAYGPTNTVVVNWTSPEQTVELKARGDFARVQKPANVKIIWSDIHSGAGKTYTTVNDVNKENTIVNFEEGYTVRVKNSATSGDRVAVGKIGILDADGTVLWTLAMWLTDGIKSVTYACGAEVMDRNLGAQKAMQNRSFKNGGAMYQWGRPVPFTWGTDALVSQGNEAKKRFTIANDVAGEFTLEKINSLPQAMLVADPDLIELAAYDWWLGDGKLTGTIADRKNDFWGNAEAGNWQAGQKTVYDPCPKGWRVASPDVISEIFNATSTDTEILKRTDSNKTKDKYYYFQAGYDITYAEDADVTFALVEGATPAFIYAYASGWVNYKSGGDNNIARPVNNTGTYAFCWTNAPVPGTHDAKAFMKKGPEKNEKSSGTYVNDEQIQTYLGARANAFPVRCMKDTEDR